MRIGFVVQRYGLEVNGGAELEARLIAEHLSPYVQIEILTTCALDYMTWHNHYKPGIELVNGIPVRRFTVRSPRNISLFNQFSANILSHPRTFYEEVQWMALQGPDVPELFDYLRRNHQRYDLLVFFTYLYSTTFWGLQIAPFKSILVPTAHDETWIYFDIFRSVFHLPRAFVFNTPEEEHFVRQLFQNGNIPGVVLGVGIEVPILPNSDAIGDEYILYLGRIDESKGCGELFRYFLAYKEATRDPVKLVLVWSQVMDIPKHPDIIALGFLEDTQRFTWLKNATLLVLPSPHESLSLAVLEAWSFGIPVLVNAKAVVLKAHCLRSKGGLYYYADNGFTIALRQLRTDGALRSRLGANGKAYVEQNYQWGRIEKQYVAFFRQIYSSTHTQIEASGKNSMFESPTCLRNLDNDGDLLDSP